MRKTIICECNANRCTHRGEMFVCCMSCCYCLLLRACVHWLDVRKLLSVYSVDRLLELSTSLSFILIPNNNVHLFFFLISVTHRLYITVHLLRHSEDTSTIKREEKKRLPLLLLKATSTVLGYKTWSTNMYIMNTHTHQITGNF